MTDQELLQAIGQVVESKIEPIRQDIHAIKEDVRALQENYTKLESRVGTLEEQITCVRVYMDTELDRTLKLLLEGQQAVWDRATPPERYDALEVRTSALEMAVRQHSQEIQELKLA